MASGERAPRGAKTRPPLAEALELDPVYLEIVAETAPSRYRIHRIPRKGKRPRILMEPDPELKFVQHELYRRLLRWIPPSEHAHGFTQGRSIITNAGPHVGKALVLNMDVRDFFPSIGPERVVAAARLLGFRAEDAELLARLTTARGGLPQGAPTSPALANFACFKLDARMGGIAKTFDLAYTRYADDLTFSGDAIHRKVIVAVRRVLGEEGFRPAEEKTKLMGRGARQLVTGLVVNDRVSVPRPVRRRLRAIAHDASKRGLEAACGERGGSWLLGHLAHLASVHPAEAADLLAQLALH